MGTLARRCLPDTRAESPGPDGRARARKGARRAIAALVFAAASALGCGGAAHRTTIERIGGVERARPFASATAYEAFLRAEILAAQGDYDAAARQLELAEIADPADGYIPARRAELLLRAGHADEALTLARGTTERLPDSAAAWLVLGEVLLSRRDDPGAARAFAAALAAAPDDPEVRAAVARARGASPDAVARAMETAPDARPGDRTVAQRMALDPLRDDRPTLRSVRRERAERAWAQQDFRAVDQLLSPLVMADPGDIRDRTRVIEARARDGRPGDAARLVAGLQISVGTSETGVALTERARLWLVAARPELAVEDATAALRADAADSRARLILGEALVRTGELARGLTLLAAVGATSARFVEARLAAADGLVRAGRGELAEAVLNAAVAMLPVRDDDARDTLRLAVARSMLARGATTEARSVLAAVASPAGRQQRGAMLAHLDAPAQVLPDLRVRTGHPGVDAVADAWIAIVCHRDAAACAPGERERALAAAGDGASGAPETLRAQALASTDRRRAQDLMRQAAARDPLSPWNGALAPALGVSSRPRGP